jgi:threonine/homoserine/homoserine lactone efflux protein
VFILSLYLIAVKPKSKEIIMLIDPNTLSALQPLWALVLPLAVFSLSMSMTPGPNNIMLASSGARFGVKRTLPHYVGIPIGFACMLLASAYGLGWVFEQAPWAQTVLKYASLLYLVYLSFRIMTSKIPSNSKEGEQNNKTRPLYIWESMLFQVVNPKAFVMTSTSISTFAIHGELYLASVLLMCAVFIFTGPLGMAGWMFLGTVLGKLLKDPIVFRTFNVVMGLLTLGSAFWAV